MKTIFVDSNQGTKSYKNVAPDYFAPRSEDVPKGVKTLTWALLVTEYQFGKTVSGLEQVGLKKKLVKSRFGVVEGEPSQEGLPGCGAEEGGIATFVDIDTDYQMLRRSANPGLQLRNSLSMAPSFLFIETSLLR